MRIIWKTLGENYIMPHDSLHEGKQTMLSFNIPMKDSHSDLNI